MEHARDMAFYRHYEQVYAKTKPIRGKDIRPIGQRRRTHEQIREIKQTDGTLAYAARLYDTDCVVFYADGTFDVSTGGWASPSTADFILRVFQSMNPRWYGGHGVYAVKARRSLWLCVRHSQIRYPIGKDPVRFYSTVDGNTQPLETLKVKVVRTNRSETAKTYEKMQPFLKWMQVFLSMSDGWLMHETRLTVTPMDISKEDSYLEYAGEPTGRYLIPTHAPSGKIFPQAIHNWAWRGYVTPRDTEVIIDWLINLEEDDYLLTFVTIAHINDIRNNHQIPNSPNIQEVATYKSKHAFFVPRYYNIRQDFTKIKRHIQNLVKKLPESQKIVETEASDKFLNNVK